MEERKDRFNQVFPGWLKLSCTMPLTSPTLPLPLPYHHDHPTEYGQVLRMLGNGRCEVYCFDGKNRLAHIRGKMRKKVWVSAVSQLDKNGGACGGL